MHDETHSTTPTEKEWLRSVTPRMSLIPSNTKVERLIMEIKIRMGERLDHAHIGDIGVVMVIRIVTVRIVYKIK